MSTVENLLAQAKAGHFSINTIDQIIAGIPPSSYSKEDINGMIQMLLPIVRKSVAEGAIPTNTGTNTETETKTASKIEIKIVKNGLECFASISQISGRYYLYEERSIEQGRYISQPIDLRPWGNPSIDTVKLIASSFNTRLIAKFNGISNTTLDNIQNSIKNGDGIKLISYIGTLTNGDNIYKCGDYVFTSSDKLDETAILKLSNSPYNNLGWKIVGVNGGTRSIASADIGNTPYRINTEYISTREGNGCIKEEYIKTVDVGSDLGWTRCASIYYLE